MKYEALMYKQCEVELDVFVKQYRNVQGHMSCVRACPQALRAGTLQLAYHLRHLDRTT